ncbi:MAG: hypothetical protein MJ094_09140 [Saccharofermentans sp.]|nr:hypothetical protein [Saccharofermentans sp.]
MKKKILTISIIALVAILLGGLYLWYMKLYGSASKIKIEEQARANYDYQVIASNHGIVSDYLWQRTKTLMTDSDANNLIPEYQMIAGRLSYQEAERSDSYRLEDQALLLRMYVRTGDRFSAISLKNSVYAYFDMASQSNRSLMAWTDAFMEYYSFYGSTEDFSRIEELRDLLFDDEGNVRAEDLTVVAYMELESNEDPTFSNVTGIEIASINLRLISELENNGMLPQGSYQKNLELVLGSSVSSELPLFAYAYVDGIYVYSHNVPAAVDVEESVITMRHLSEVDELPDSSYAWLKNTLMNNGVLRSQFYYSQGITSGEEAADIYPDIMHIALCIDDSDLYERAATLIGMRVATYNNSPALSMVFREIDGRFIFYARENIDICLAVA